MQHDLYHHFTVDEHTLRAVETLDELHTSENKHRAHLRAVFEQLEDPTLLYLALLLHDIGKGQGRGHIARGAKLAERVCRRLRLKEDGREEGRAAGQTTCDDGPPGPKTRPERAPG